MAAPTVRQHYAELAAQARGPQMTARFATAERDRQLPAKRRAPVRRDTRLRDLRRMRTIATLAAGADAADFRGDLVCADRSGPGCAYLRAFAEAGMVGACADWFAVVALFRHPLGIPIPHTAIVPHNKARIAGALGRFIANNFLSP